MRQIILNLEDDKSYIEHGKLAKERILNLIEAEGIQVKESFNYSLVDLASYVKVTKNTKNNLETSHFIIVPQFTDLSDLRQAIILAHELGHYQVFCEIEQTKNTLLLLKIKLSTYYNERLAWKKAEEILVKENILPETIHHKEKMKRDNTKGSQEQIAAFKEFSEEKGLRLSTYRDAFFNNLLSPFVMLTKFGISSLAVLVLSYLIIGITFVFKQNGVPFPIDINFSSEAVYPATIVLFVFLMPLYITLKFMVRVD